MRNIIFRPLILTLVSLYFLSLPHPVWAAPLPDGAACTNDFECNSGKCIFNSTGQRVCAAKILSPQQIGVGSISVPATANNSINDIVESFSNFLIGSGAAVFLFVFSWGAIQWLSSGGDKAALEKAKSTITYAALGIVLLATSFAIFTILKILLTST